MMFETSKNVSLAQKSGFIFKNSCALMVITVVNFENMNNVYTAKNKRNKIKRRIRSIGPGKGSDRQ